MATNVQNVDLGVGNLSALSQSGIGKFPNPFFDIASEFMPRDPKQIFELCEYCYLTYGTYRSAARKVVRYFLTEVVLDGESEPERVDFKDFLENKLHIMSELANIGDEYMTYGQSFVSMYFPFDRFLICPQCGMEYQIKTIPYKFKAKKSADIPKPVFTATCKSVSCGYTGEFKVSDRRSTDRSKVRIRRWNPKLMNLRYHDISGEIEYHMTLDPLFVKKIEEGRSFFIDSTPMEVLDAIAQAKDGPVMFKFDADSIYHLREATLAGLPIKGWGIPAIMANFKLIYYIQILRRYDEAIAFDYIMPFRILHPDKGQSPTTGLDFLQASSMGVFASHMQNMIKQRRMDPTSIQVAPFPVGYLQAGGDARALSPKDNIGLALDELLNAVGFPAELYKGTLQIQAFPVALRLFEKTWGNMVDGFNDLIGWIITRTSRYFAWGPEVSGKLRSVTLADDLERKALQLQAAAGMDISKSTAYRVMDIDYMDEQRKVVEEQKKIQELQQEAMESQEAAQGQASGGGGPGGQPGATPGDIYEQGKQLAYQLVTQTPETLRRGELIKIKHSNPTLHAIVLQQMSELRNEMSRQGQAMMLEQTKQEGMAKTGEFPAWSPEDLKTLPSPLRLSLLIADQVMDYNKQDLTKIAMDIKRGTKHADKAFSFIYRRITGIE